MKEKKLPQNNIKLWLSLIVRMALFALALMWPAGTWYWWEAWIIVGLWTSYAIVMTQNLLRHDPTLLAERMKLVPLHKEQKKWDKVLMLLFMIMGIGLYIVPGFDVVRYEWSDPFPVWMRISAMILHLPCFLLLGWVLRENTYLSKVVKIDKDRDQHVITTGPYKLVRHPMYLVVIILLFAVPVALGSRFSLIFTLILTVLLVVRTYLEDRALHTELEDYSEYAKQTKYRLIPGVW
jgi:protein-S-isoprenylcysteine O-methyltransferase Ste14